MRTTQCVSCLVLLSFLLAGCGGGGGGGDDTAGEPPEAKSRLQLFIADSPIDGVDAVFITVSGIVLTRAGGESVEIDFNEPHPFDLLKTAGGNARLLVDGRSVPPGEYEALQVRLIESETAYDSYVHRMDGGELPLHVPPDCECLLDVQETFTMPEDGETSLVLDIDLRASLLYNPGDSAYRLRPKVRLVRSEEAGAITGSLAAAALLAPECTSDANSGRGAAVYVYPGAASIFDDLGNSGSRPLATGSVTPNASTGDYDFHIAYLPAADYQVLYTCQAWRDNPEADDEVVMSAPVAVAVAPGKAVAVSLGG